MSTPRDQNQVSKACLHAGSKNVHCQSELQRELALLEKEKSRHIQHINHEAKQVRQRFADHSPGSRPSSGVGNRLGSATPRRSDAGLAASPRGSPPRGSPGSPALLPRRRSASATKSGSPESQRKHHAGQVFVTEFGTSSLHPVSVEHVQHAQSSQHSRPPTSHEVPAPTVEYGGLPRIIVSDAADRPFSVRHSGRGRKNLQRRSSGQQNLSRSGSESESEHEQPLSQSLNLPSHRPRSHSMPSSKTLPSVFKPPPRRPSYLDHHSDLRVPLGSPRVRSSSFSGIVPSRRRGSISEQWGSISERNRPLMGSFRGRKTSVDMENILRDLTYGVQHTELMSAAAASSVSDRQWEELKKCRYLRNPSTDNSEEDIREEGTE